MAQTLWQYRKSFGGISFGITIETVNRFTNLGNYAKGIVYLQGKIVDTIWFGSKEEYNKGLEEIKLVSKFFNMSDPLFLSPIQMSYLLDQNQNAEYFIYSHLLRFQHKSWLEKFIKDDHFLSKFSYSGTCLTGAHKEQFCDYEGILGPTKQQDYILREVEITNNANNLRVDFAVFQQPSQSKTFVLAPYFYKCAKVAMILNVLYSIMKYNQHVYIWSLPRESSANISWGMKDFVNNYMLYPSKL